MGQLTTPKSCSECLQQGDCTRLIRTVTPQTFSRGVHLSLMIRIIHCSALAESIFLRSIPICSILALVRARGLQQLLAMVANRLSTIRAICKKVTIARFGLHMPTLMKELEHNRTKQIISSEYQSCSIRMQVQAGPEAQLNRGFSICEAILLMINPTCTSTIG